MNKIITDILTDEQIEKDVKSCVNDLLDKVEKTTKKLYRKRPINKNDWVVTKRKKAHEEGKEHTNGKGKVIAAKKIVSMKNCQNKCKFNCALNIDKETQEKIFGDLSTLAVSQKMVYNVHEKKDKVTGILKADGRGKHNKHHRVTEEQREEVIVHINSFPVVDPITAEQKPTRSTWKLG